jgi:hypothetical protein
VVHATVSPADAFPDIKLDFSNLAEDWIVETIPAVAADAGGPYWEVAPEHLRLTLEGYPVTDHLMKPQIFVYPREGLAVFNEAADQIATDLQRLLQTQEPINPMPFLPLFNATQVTHTQMQFLDFQDGSGVRYLTQFDQAPLPINSFELIYTFQGLTDDGRYYIAAILPVMHPDLPATQQGSPEQAAELDDFPEYLTETVAWLSGQPPGSFTPDLTQLDALIRSIGLN